MADMKKTLTAVDKSTKALTKSAVDLGKTLTDAQALVKDLGDTVSAISSDIEFKTSELNNIEAQTKEKQREANAELRLRILENEDKVLDELMVKCGLAKVSKADHKALTDALTAAESSNEVEITKAVKAVESRMKSSFDVEKAQVKAKHEVETAELKASINSLGSKVNFLTDSNEQLQRTLDEERKARVEVAKASQNVFNMPDSK